MNVTYNLSKRAEKAIVLSMLEWLHIAGDFLDVYAGRDKGTNFLCLVRAGRSNVLLHSAEVVLLDPPRNPPARPWAFRIESHEPLLVGAEFHYASSKSVDIWLGRDHNNDEFVALRPLLDAPIYLFRVPGGPHGRANPLPYWQSEPLKSTASERAEDLIHQARYGSGTGDPELDSLLGGLP